MKKDSTKRWITLLVILIVAVIGVAMATAGKLGVTALKVTAFGSDQTKKDAAAAAKQLDAKVEADKKAAAAKK